MKFRTSFDRSLTRRKPKDRTFGVRRARCESRKKARVLSRNKFLYDSERIAEFNTLCLREVNERRDSVTSDT